MLGQARRKDVEEATVVVAGEPHAPPFRLLVIDDDSLHRMIICRVAVKVGCIPVEAASYEEAVSLTQEQSFDGITLDLSLGQHAGVEFLRHLRGIGCKAPIIIISGTDNLICKETLRLGTSLDLNVTDLVPKPVDLALLHRALERVRIQSEVAAIAAPR